MSVEYLDFKIKTIDELSLQDKRVFIRCDFNVPLDEGRITDDTRIKAVLPTIQYALDQNAKVVLGSHLGRPQGTKSKELSLEPVGVRLSELLGKDVIFTDDCIGEAVSKIINEAHPGVVILLENLRFNSAESKNHPNFAHHMSEYIDVYVNDAFGVSHRSEASVDALPKLIQEKGCGFLIKKEIENLNRVIEHPERSYVAIIGGAKVSDKIDLLRNLMVKADVLLIGGALAYTLLHSQGHQVGSSKIENDKLGVARNLFEKADQEKVELVLPCDHVVSKSPSQSLNTHTTEGIDIEDDFYGVDIGPQTIKLFLKYISKAKTVVWNGPLGVYEVKPFDSGTNAIAEAIGESRAFSIVGGGDCVAAVQATNVAHKISHLSTGGGASLTYLEGKVLPGLVSLTS